MEQAVAFKAASWYNKAVWKNPAARGTVPRRGADQKERLNLMDEKKVMLSGIQPSGDLTLGSYLGAIKNWGARAE